MPDDPPPPRSVKDGSDLCICREEEMASGKLSGSPVLANLQVTVNSKTRAACLQPFFCAFSDKMLMKNLETMHKDSAKV